MSETIAEFVRTGVANYAEAQQTVSFFREQVFKILEQALKTGLADGGLVLAKKLDSRRQAGDYGQECWVSIFANADAKGRSVRVELGVLWNPSTDRDKAACIVYANLRDGDPTLVRFTFAPGDPHPRVREVASGKWTRVCVTVGTSPDLAKDASEVLATLQDRVGRVARSC